VVGGYLFLLEFECLCVHNSSYSCGDSPERYDFSSHVLLWCLLMDYLYSLVCMAWLRNLSRVKVNLKFCIVKFGLGIRGPFCSYVAP
jgi:hypothetical protein